MRKILFSILLIFTLSASKELCEANFFIFNFSFAQAPGWTPACDPCGFCVGGEKPADWEKCVACLSQKGKTWTVLGCIPTNPGGFIQIIIKTTVKIIGGTTFLALLYGGFLLLTSGGEVEKINKGKTIVTSSIIGLLVVIFSVFILRLIGVEILKIPGFE